MNDSTDLVEAALEEIDRVRYPLNKYVEALRILKTEIEIRIMAVEDYIHCPEDYQEPESKICRIVK